MFYMFFMLSPDNVFLSLLLLHDICCDLPSVLLPNRAVLKKLYLPNVEAHDDLLQATFPT